MSHSQHAYSEKISSEFYMPSVLNESKSKFDPQNVLLCQYDMIDVAVHLKMQSPKSRILLHNFANNNKPCDGLWSSLTQENQIYNRTNIKDLVLPVQHKLYPIQDAKHEHDHIGNYLTNIIITKNCQILKTADGKSLTPAIVDIVSLDALPAPAEKNLDLYSTSEYTRCDYAKTADKEKTYHRIKFLLTYAIGEQYDYLITGAWGLGAFLNPHWGLINLWNHAIHGLPTSKLKILFSINVCDDPDSESIYIYKYFNQYLIGQMREQTLDFNKIEEEKRIKEDIEKLSEDEVNIKKKIYGLIWGMALGEILSYYYNNAQQDNNTAEKWKIMASTHTLDWDACTDHTIILMRVMRESAMDIDVHKMAKYLIDWKSVGFRELPERSTTCLDSMTKHIISQTDYIYDPIDVARRIYMAKGAEDMSSNAIGRNALNGIFKDFGRRALISCRMLQPDTACQVSCLVHAYIINCLWNGKYITTEDWGHLMMNCHKIFDTNQSNATQHKIDFDNFWSIGRNYQYQINAGIKDYVFRNLKPGPMRSENYTFMPMSLAMIIMYDIQGHVLVDGRHAREMMSVTEIPALDDKLRNKKIEFHEMVPADYYFRTMEDLVEINSNYICDAVMGSVLGMACWNNVYNDEVVRDGLGHLVETDSQNWVKYATEAEWLNGEIDQFIEQYLEGRRRHAALQQQNARAKRQAEERIQQPVELYDGRY